MKRERERERVKSGTVERENLHPEERERYVNGGEATLVNDCQKKISGDEKVAAAVTRTAVSRSSYVF